MTSRTALGLEAWLAGRKREGEATVRVDTYDVFAERAFAGNQLAVFSGADVAWLSDEALVKLAAEMGYAESTFALEAREVGSKTRASYRIFTSEKELPFAGHPTLGTAEHVLRGLDGVKDVVDLECREGVVTVTREGALLWMLQPAPRLGQPIAVEAAATALGCAVSDVDASYPPTAVCNGPTFVIVAMNTLDALKALKHTGPQVLGRLCRRVGAVGVYAVFRGGRDASHDISARSFVDETAVPEDPATGSACGCFAAWGIANAFLSDPVRAVVGQGHEIPRPSLLHLKAHTLPAASPQSGGGSLDKTNKPPAFHVQVGGKVARMLTGATLNFSTFSISPSS